MISAVPIVLAADFDAIEALVILAFVVISIVSGIIQKANKSKAERKEQDEAAARRRRRAQAAKPPGTDARPAAGAETLEIVQPVSTARTVPPVVPQVRPQRPPAAKKTPLRGLKPKKTSIASRRTGSARVGSAHVGRMEHVETGRDTETRPAIQVDLSAADSARRAILLHEIFSGPKALRNETEMWEM